MLERGQEEDGYKRHQQHILSPPPRKSRFTNSKKVEQSLKRLIAPFAPSARPTQFMPLLKRDLATQKAASVKRKKSVSKDEVLRSSRDSKLKASYNSMRMMNSSSFNSFDRRNLSAGSSILERRIRVANIEGGAQSAREVLGGHGDSALGYNSFMREIKSQERSKRESERAVKEFY